MEIKIKLSSENAVAPKYSHLEDAGADLTATTKDTSNPLYIEYDTNVHFEIPPLHVGLLFPRSSLSNKDLVLANSVGVLDSNYRGSVKFRFKSTTGNNHTGKHYEVGDRVGQIIVLPYPKINYKIVKKLEDSERGENGYGSTGN